MFRDKAIVGLFSIQECRLNPARTCRKARPIIATSEVRIGEVCRQAPLASWIFLVFQKKMSLYLNNSWCYCNFPTSVPIVHNSQHCIQTCCYIILT